MFEPVLIAMAQPRTSAHHPLRRVNVEHIACRWRDALPILVADVLPLIEQLLALACREVTTISPTSCSVANVSTA